MWERDAVIRISRETKEAGQPRGQTFEDWFKDQRELAVAIDEDRVFQKIGEHFLRLKITDINPLGEPSLAMEPKGPIEIFRVSAKIYKEIKNKPGNLRNWVLRVLNLGIMGPNMNLYFFDGQEYCSIRFTPDADAKDLI